ncbi:MAG: 50S ribosomal protein L11 methyltransferase [Bacteroidota bacterium]|nr:50S ribosomal protein L11 methyltransferase [Bacteroidota bacterium]
MAWLELMLKMPPPEQEVWIAKLAEEGFDSFLEEESALKAYVLEEVLTIQQTEQLLKDMGLVNEYSISKIPDQNWNNVWESNFQPVTIAGKIHIRAPHHHKKSGYPTIELLIQPKMSFGTGHHATTSLVLEWLLEVPVLNKSLLDFGCGTAILAIAAQKLGASPVMAVDNDPQCILNSEENIQLNDTDDIKIRLGDVNAVGSIVFDIIVANITRNVLLQFAGDIEKKLKNGGLFITSGFYLEDLDILVKSFSRMGLDMIGSKSQDKWCAAFFKKN